MADNRPDNQEVTLEKRGVRISKKRRPVNFIGSSRDQTFAKLAAEAAARIGLGQDNFAAIGSFYENGLYARQNGRRPYEAVYGDEDYTLSASDPSVQQALDQVYGDRNGQAGVETGLATSTVRAALGSSQALPNVPSLPERGDSSSLAQNLSSVVRDEELASVRLVADFDAPIEPVI